MKAFTKNLFFISFVLFSSILSAEEDDDFEFDFTIHQKSTIENFPLQAIDQEALSDTAIEGALQVQNQQTEDSEGNRKPIYQKVKEEDQKEQTKKVLSETKKDVVDPEDLLKFSQILPSQPQFKPIIYQQPTGRTYTDHQTTTISRP